MFNIQFDYRFDTNGFFGNAQRSVLETAAAIWESHIKDEFTNVPVGTQLSVTNPQTNQNEQFLADFAIDDLVIFVGARQLGTGTLGQGGPSAIYTIGSDLDTRFNGDDFEPWTGAIAFDTSTNWFFDSTPNTDNDIPANSNDFLTTALHEIGHVLGFSTSVAFDNLVFGTSLFTGSNAISLNGGNGIPLELDGHIQDGFLIGGVGPEALMDPTITVGTRKLPTNLDLAILADIGYQIDQNNPQNNPPLANNDNGITTESATVTIDLLNNDTDPDSNDILSIESIDTTNTQGNINDNGNGTVTYDPSGQFENLQSGQTTVDTFSYILTDGQGGIDTATVTITINGEDDSPPPPPPPGIPGITLSPISGNTSENGGTATFTVVLNSQPTANVTIGISSSDGSEGTINLSSLTFTTANWNTAQTVTVTGVDDSIVDGNITYNIITAPASSADPQYNGLDSNDLSLTNLDNDTPSGDPLINPVYRFFNTVAGGHFFTTSETERNFVLNNLPQYVFEGIGFNASIVDGPDLVPIYRFFNTVAGGHFFTASETERNFVLNNLPQFIDEGIGFYAFGADANLGADVFRFFNTVAGGHFFTTSTSERDFVLNNLPQYNDEGIGFEAGLA
jgi:VCBS repeat-containing protein